VSSSITLDANILAVLCFIAKIFGNKCMCGEEKQRP